MHRTLEKTSPWPHDDNEVVQIKNEELPTSGSPNGKPSLSLYMTNRVVDRYDQNVGKTASKRCKIFLGAFLIILIVFVSVLISVEGAYFQEEFDLEPVDASFDPSGYCDTFLCDKAECNATTLDDCRTECEDKFDGCGCMGFQFDIQTGLCILLGGPRDMVLKKNGPCITALKDAMCNSTCANSTPTHVLIEVHNTYQYVQQELQLAESLPQRSNWWYLIIAILMAVAQCIVVMLILPATPINMLAGYIFCAEFPTPPEFTPCMLGHQAESDNTWDAHTIELFIWNLTIASVVALVGILLSGALSFAISRYVAAEWTSTLLEKRPKFKAVSQAVARSGFKIVFLVTLAPVFPAGICHYLFGITEVRFWPYMLATFIGLIPGTVAFAYFGSSLRQIMDMFTNPQQNHSTAHLCMLVLTVISTIVAVIVISVVTHRALKDAVREFEALPPAHSVVDLGATNDDTDVDIDDDGDETRPALSTPS